MSLSILVKLLLFWYNFLHLLLGSDKHILAKAKFRDEHELYHMDRDVHLKRAKMEFTNMPARADMDQNLQRDIEYETKMDQIRMEGKLMQEHAKIDRKAEIEKGQIVSSNQSDVSESQSPRVIVMEFRVFKDRKLSHVPDGYINRPGEMTFVEPGKVEWSEMVLNLWHQGYKGSVDLYYIKPGCVPPQGMIMISGKDDVHQMMQALEGIKKCDLFIVRNCLDSESENSEYGLSEDEWECPYPFINIGQKELDEDGTSPSIMHSSLNNIKKELSFDNVDEQNNV